jgi:hypothetical protein
LALDGYPGIDHIMPSFSEFATTVLASAIGALAAGAVGFRYAMAKFQRERAYDRQLAWYERATAVLLSAARKLSWAIGADNAQMSELVRAKAWEEAIEELLGLRALEIEAEMYASPESYEALREAIDDVLTVAETAPTIERAGKYKAGPPRGQLFVVSFKLLYNAASRLAADVRVHLKLKPVDREPRLYDKEFRELQADLQHHKELGRDYGNDATEAAV